VVVSTEEGAVQGILKVEIISTISADEAHKKVIEHVEQALREVLGKKEDA
jgi:hypothetical protein